VTMSRPVVAMRVDAMKRALGGSALQVLDLQVRRQAMVMAFERLFLICGIAFLCVLPLVFFLKMPEGAEKMNLHVE